MPSPLVSVICICHNHERFVEEALLSAINQTHHHLEVLVVDNGSSDKSVENIKAFLKAYPQIRFIEFPKDISYPKAFNLALAQINGDFVIDLAGDDILMSNRIEEGLKDFENKGSDFGVHFSDGWMMDESGKELYLHSDRFPHQRIPEGDIYKELVGRYFILTPSMMIQTSLLRDLGGYDEELSYEDFDFWIRSARITKYSYSPKPLVKKRIVAGSMSSSFYRFASPHLKSTLMVCKKIYKLNQNKEEDGALQKRIFYEAWQTIKLARLGITFQYLILWLTIKLR